MYNNTHAYTRPTKACNVWWRTEEGGGGGVGDGDGDGVGVIVGVGVGTVVASSSEAAVARRRWCGWWPWRSLSGGDGCADGGGGGVSGGGVGGGSVGVGTGVDGLAARVLGVPGRHPVAPPCHGARREESNPGPRQQGAAGADHHRGIAVVRRRCGKRSAFRPCSGCGTPQLLLRLQPRPGGSGCLASCHSSAVSCGGGVSAAGGGRGGEREMEE